MREIWSRPANKRLPFVFTSTAHKWWAAPQWMSGGFLTILIQMHETKQEGSRALEAKVGGELMAVQMPRQSSFQVDSEQGVGRRACRSGEEGEQGVGRRNHVEWGGGPSGSGEEGPRGVGRRNHVEWGGGTTWSGEEDQHGVGRRAHQECGGRPVSVCCVVSGDTGGEVPRTGNVWSLFQTMCSGP